MSRMTIGLLSEEAHVAEDNTSVLEMNSDLGGDRVIELSADCLSMDTLQEVALDRPDEAMNEGEAKLASAALEAILNKYSAELPPSLAVESLMGHGMARRQLANQSAHVKGQLLQSRNVAMEGWFDKLKMRADSYTTSWAKIDARYEEVVRRYEEKGCLPQDTVLNGPFTSVLSQKGGSTLTAKEAIDNLGKITKVLSDPNMAVLMKDLVRFIEEVEDNVRSNWFIANDMTVLNIKKIGKSAEGIRDRLNAIAGDAKQSNTETTAEPIQERDLVKIKQAREALRHRTDLDAIARDFKKAAAWSAGFMLLNSKIRLMQFVPLPGSGLLAADIRNGIVVQSRITSIFGIIADLIAQRDHALYALNVWISKSTA